MHLTDKQDLFLSVIQAHKGIIYKVANAYCPLPADREDLVQEIIFQLWRSFGSYTDQYKYSTWIYRIALNVAISGYRRESRRKKVADPLTEGVLNLVDTTVPDETAGDISILHQFIAALKELDKALMLLYLEERSYREIAGILGMSETNVSTRIDRIRKKLKQKFSTIKK